MSEIEREDVIAIMVSRIQARWKLDLILGALEEDDGAEEADG